MIDPADLSYKVRVWDITTYSGARGKTYRVRWKVGTKEFKQPFKTSAQADAFRSELVQAQSRGEAFSQSQGLPVGKLRKERPDQNWLDFACDYVDHKWPEASAKHRGNIAFALTMATFGLLTSDRGKPDDRILRSALRSWAFSKTRRDSPDRPAEVDAALAWVRRNCRSVSELADPKVSAAAVKAASTKLDGTKAALSSRRRNHSILKAAVEFAVASDMLDSNPIEDPEQGTSRAIHQVDRRVVVNPSQARALLDAVREYGYEETEKRRGQKSGPRLVAFFGAMYYAALRPEEAVNLNKANLSLRAPRRVESEDGDDHLVYDWGWIYPEEVTPDARPEFTNDGSSRDRRRQLKQREKGETRPVPCPPELSRLLSEHLAEFGTDKEGRLFTGVGGRPLATITYRRAWRFAREKALTEQEQRSPLAATPYSLRHTCVSTWLNAGVSETFVAQWAGHSVAVLKRIYAKCLVGEEERAMQLISEALRR